MNSKQNKKYKREEKRTTQITLMESEKQKYKPTTLKCNMGPIRTQFSGHHKETIFILFKLKYINGKVEWATRYR